MKKEEREKNYAEQKRRTLLATGFCCKTVVKTKATDIKQ